MTQEVGFVPYHAPEMEAFSGERYDEKVDMWALGVIVCELLTGMLVETERIELLRGRLGVWER